MSFPLVKVPKPKSKPKARRTPLKHGKPLPRTTRMKSRGPRTKKSGGALFPKNVDEPYREHIRGLPCLLTDRCCYLKGGIPVAQICVGSIQACHVKSRGAGGKDRNNLYPGCSAAHDQQGIIGISAFNKRWGLDLAFVARRYTEVYEAEKFPCP